MAKILIADDYELTVEMLEKILEQAGHEVISTEDGKYVAGLIRQERPELVILDVYMPEKDGIATILEIRKHWPTLPVISITAGGKTGHDYSEEMADLGANAYFNKPIDSVSLLSTIDSILGL